jgi:tetratricopeptide (TPR) repeat protein
VCASPTGLNFAGDVSNVKASRPDDLDQPFELSYDYVRKDYSDWDHNQITPPLPPIGIEVAKIAKDIKPQDPVLLGGMGKVTYRARIELPPGYSATAPSDCHLVDSFAEYTDEIRIEGPEGGKTFAPALAPPKVIIATRELVLKKQEVPLSEWEQYRKFGRGMSDDESNYITLSHTGSGTEMNVVGADGKSATGSSDLDATFREAQQAMQSRDAKRAQELYEKVIAKDPKYKLAHFYLAVALATQNQMGEALQQFRAEEEVQPGDPRAYEAAASLMTFRGRTDDAIDEWRKLLKADPSNRTAITTLSGLLMAQQKYADAVNVLESAVASVNGNAFLQYQLGLAYLKTGQTEKAVEHMNRALEQKKDDVMMLNNVAWAFAENNSNLDLAKKYAQSAVDELDDQSRNSDASNEFLDANRTYLYSLVWDTFGWVYYQEGDAKAAEALIRPAWLLGEDSLVGEHLGEIYEKQGKNQLAARAYERALATPVHVYSSVDAQEQYQKQQSEIRARYKKLTGKEAPLAAIRRLPNGQWTETPAEQLRHSREIKVSNGEKMAGFASFVVRIGPDKVESAHWESGDESLKPIAQQLTAAHYPLEFPPGSQAVLVVGLSVDCHATGPCIATLQKPAAESRPSVPPLQGQ